MSSLAAAEPWGADAAEPRDEETSSFFFLPSEGAFLAFLLFPLAHVLTLRRLCDIPVDRLLALEIIREGKVKIAGMVSAYGV